VIPNSFTRSSVDVGDVFFGEITLLFSPMLHLSKDSYSGKNNSFLILPLLSQKSNELCYTIKSVLYQFTFYVKM